jgi:hypothetical protein
MVELTLYYMNYYIITFSADCQKGYSSSKLATFSANLKYIQKHKKKLENAVHRALCKSNETQTRLEFR